MEENKNTSEKLVDAASNWIDTYRNILTIRLVEHSSKGASLSIFGILAMVVVGGMGSIWGVVAGAIILSAINNYLLPNVLYDVPSTIAGAYSASDGSDAKASPGR